LVKGGFKMYFEPYQFIKNLSYMGVGMLGIFIIIAIIMLATYAIGRIGVDEEEE
jgi:hypothetical protein